MEFGGKGEETNSANRPAADGSAKQHVSGEASSIGVDTNFLQFDPAPRRGEPHVTRRTPSYFL